MPRESIIQLRMTHPPSPSVFDTAGLDLGTRFPQSGYPDTQDLLGRFALFQIKSSDQIIWPRDTADILV